MLAIPIVNSWGFAYQNQANGSNQPGTQLTASGTPNTMGSWTSVATGANIASTIYYVVLQLTNGASAGGAREHLFDFGWDPAGGTSYTTFINQMISGQAILGSGRMYHFPCHIPAGSQVAMRMQSNTGSMTCKVLAKFYGKPSRPDLWPLPAYSERIGTITNSDGVSFTPGNAADGTWVSLGTTTKRLWWWQLGHQINNAVLNTLGTRVQLAVGDASNKRVIIDMFTITDASENTFTPMQSPCQWDVPAGSTLYVRGNCAGAPDTGHNAVALGFGG